MANIYDVAKAAGVSPATVSRALNGGSVSPERAARVQAACEELGFRPNRVARGLRRQRSDVLALIISDIENPFFTALARGVEDVARASNLSVVLCNADDNPEKEAEYLDVALAEHMAGVVIFPASVTETDVTALLDRGVPVVAVDRAPESAAIDTVTADDENGAYAATRHLLDEGYRRIACITGSRGSAAAMERLRGFLRAHREGDAPRRRPRVAYADFRVRGGYQAMNDLLDLPEPPDAVLVTNNLMASGALEALHGRGLRPPGIGLASFGDTHWSHLVEPALTTVHQPAYEIGRSAAELLLQRREAPDTAPQRLILPTRLEVRGSSRRAADSSPPPARKVETRVSHPETGPRQWARLGRPDAAADSATAAGSAAR
ncbi:LacI family DNA-binding transcriptional regulator [Micromonospora endophytica]|uniref:LacI family transcriptional regulator n=1 Tax=Micromonospora endophytica TaxID=515350 RepID=A0A2W2DDC1_9ACTN|nr:LacI family DNA-binding transcriptional regulator [Micromonospora endophytica]PZF97817.1 LacI family transcriptional regulator [Micromonospora endophytica]RIW43257.1 LacI family transcriptional regulator [Micromonospora endophytica]